MHVNGGETQTTLRTVMISWSQRFNFQQLLSCIRVVVIGELCLRCRLRVQSSTLWSRELILAHLAVSCMTSKNRLRHEPAVTSSSQRYIILLTYYTVYRNYRNP